MFRLVQLLIIKFQFDSFIIIRFDSVTEPANALADIIEMFSLALPILDAFKSAKRNIFKQLHLTLLKVATIKICKQLQ